MINLWNNQWSKSFVAALVIVLLLLSDVCAYIGYFSTVLCEEKVYCKMLFQRQSLRRLSLAGECLLTHIRDSESESVINHAAAGLGPRGLNPLSFLQWLQTIGTLTPTLRTWDLRWEGFRAHTSGLLCRLSVWGREERHAAACGLFYSLSLDSAFFLFLFSQLLCEIVKCSLHSW